MNEERYYSTPDTHPDHTFEHTPFLPSSLDPHIRSIQNWLRAFVVSWFILLALALLLITAAYMKAREIDNQLGRATVTSTTVTTRWMGLS